MQPWLFAGAALMPFAAVGQDSEVTVAIKGHRFQPSEVTVAAGRRVTLIVDNQDPTPEEFESRELRVEKIVPGGTQARVTVGPLKPGRYPFFGEFHEATAQGAVIAK